MTDNKNLSVQDEIHRLTIELYGQLPTIPSDKQLTDPLSQVTPEQLKTLRKLKRSITKGLDVYQDSESTEKENSDKGELNDQDDTEDDNDNDDGWRVSNYLPNSDIERLLHNEMTYYRYLSGYEWSFELARQKLRAMIEWRSRERPDLYEFRDTLKQVGPSRLLQVYGYDREFRPVIYANMKNLDSEGSGWDSEENMLLKFKYFVYITERAIERMEQTHPFVYQALWIIDMDGCSVGLGLVKRMKDMFVQLGECHADRLSAAIICNTGWTLNILWSFVKVFLSEQLIQKYKFVKKGNTEELAKVIDGMLDRGADGSNLLEHLGGSVSATSVFNCEKISRLEELKKQLKTGSSQ